MKRLLDVNVLLAAIWSDHSRHSEAFAWLRDKEIAVCPLGELGFLRISSNPRVIGAPMEQARVLLERFLEERKVARIADDLPALSSRAATSDAVTDMYLAELAKTHDMRLATFDRNLAHSAVELIG